MKQNIFKGLGIALVTPFTKEGAVDYLALKTMLEYLLSNGVDFLCILATTGETPTLTAEERQMVKDTIVGEVRGQVPILMGLGGNNTAEVVKALHTTDLRGIDGILSVCPYYNKPSQEGLYQHFKTIAEASPLPVVLYNVPGRTGVNLKAETTLRLARDCEKIVAVKEASGNITQVDDIIKNKPEGFDVLSGDDGITYPLITLGAKGVISVIGNALPQEFGRMVRLALDGDYENARLIHHKFTELFKLLFVDGNPAGVKAMLSIMGLVENYLRLPLVPTQLSTLEKIQHIINELHIKCHTHTTALG